MAAGGPQDRLLVTAGAAVLVATLVWRLTILTQWSWFQDDWVYMTDAAEQPFLSYVFQTYNGHLMPGQFLLFWLWVHAAPLEFGLAIATILAMAGASLFAWIALLRELFGRKLWALIPVVVLCLSPVFLPTTLWTAAALQTFSLQASMGWTLLFAVRWWKSGSTRPLVLMTLSYVIGLVFWQKALLISIPVIGVLVFLTARRGDGGWVRLRSPLAILAGASVAYVGAYLVLTASDAAERPGLTPRGAVEVFSYFRTGLISSALPAVLGGPWGAPPSLLSGSPTPTSWQELLILLGLATVMIAALMNRRGAWIPFLTGLTYAICAWGMVLLSNRYDVLGTFGILDARYVADSVAVFVLIGALMLFPLHEEGLQRAYRFSVTHSFERWMAAGAGGVAALIAVSSLYTNARAWDQVSESSPKAWVDNAVRAMEAVGTRAIYDSTAPNEVALTWAFPESSRISRIFSPLDLHARFNGTAERLITLDDLGRTTWAEIGEGIRSLPGPVADCGYLVKPGETAFVPMNSPAYFWDWGVTVHYFSQQGGALRVQTNNRWNEVPLPQGVGSVQTVIVDDASALLLSSSAGSGPICVERISFGEVRPGPPVD